MIIKESDSFFNRLPSHPSRIPATNISTVGGRFTRSPIKNGIELRSQLQPKSRSFQYHCRRTTKNRSIVKLTAKAIKIEQII